MKISCRTVTKDRPAMLERCFSFYQRKTWKDGQLRRYAINQNGTLNYFLWDGLDLLQEIKSDGTVQEEYTQGRSPIPGIGQLVEVNRPGVVPQKIYPLTDSRGTITKYLQTDGTTVVASRESDSFGNLIPNSAVGTWPGIFGYEGQAWKEIKSANGAQRLMLSPTRLYDPVDGKFLSKDVSMMGDLGVVPQLIIPTYRYGKQNPVSLVDTLGRDIQYGLGMNVVIHGIPFGQPSDQEF